MSTLSIRLPEDLDRQLEKEAKLSHKKRSELVRDALAEYLRKRERDRFMAELVAEARAAHAAAAIRREALQIEEEFLPLDNEALDIAEERKPGDPWPEELGEKWWK